MAWGHGGKGNLFPYPSLWKDRFDRLIDPLLGSRRDHEGRCRELHIFSCVIMVSGSSEGGKTSISATEHTKAVQH